jgi:hypothetical protein
MGSLARMNEDLGNNLPQITLSRSVWLGTRTARPYGRTVHYCMRTVRRCMRMVRLGSLGFA